MTARFGWADPAFHAEFPAIRESSVLSHSPVGTDGHPASGPLGSDNQVVSNALVRDPAIQGVVRIDDSSTNSVAAVTEFVFSWSKESAHRFDRWALVIRLLGQWGSVPVVRRRSDGSDDRLAVLAFGDDLVRDLAAVDLDRSGELERDSNPITLDRRDANDADRCGGISDDHFFAFSSGDD